MIKSLSAKTHIAMSQTSLLVTLLLLAMFIGLVPDRDGAIREGRASLAEAIAANSSTLITRNDIERIQGMLELVVDRNSDVLSAAIRRETGEALVTVGDHERHWLRDEGEHSTDSQVRLPLWSADGKWGQIELRCQPLRRAGLLGRLLSPGTQLVLFLALSCFVAFYFYLGKVLQHLNPNRAIPPHVRSALDTLAGGLLVVDLKGNIVLANRAFAGVCGGSADALMGRQIAKLAWTTTQGEPVEHSALPWARALHDGEAQRNDMIHLRDTAGKLRSFLVNCSPVLGGGGKHSGVLISFEDVTELEEHREELREAKDLAESANRAKSEFLANMSHEIRTPMNAILGFTDVLKRGYAKTENEARKYLNTIHSSGKHLLQLINDVLDLSKVEAGHLDVEQVGFAPHQVILEVLMVLQVKADERHIGLDLRVDGPVPESVQSDPTRLRQIVTNLVGNAIKFTDEGGVTVAVGLDGNTTEPMLVIEVIDTGIGMAEDKLESIFDPFIQADSSIVRRFGGTGLGLAISRRFARALGGDIVVTSRPGQGSVFRVTIAPGPLEGVRLLGTDEVHAAQTQARDETRTHWHFSGARVLAVDDGVENRELLEVVLGDVGLVVDTAENGQVGVDKALAQPYDVILMDMQMPVMDGHQATRMLRERGYDRPIVALSANAMKGFEQACLEAGCNDYLTKPIDADQLLARLAGMLGGVPVSDAEAALQSATMPEAAPESPAPAADAQAPLESRLPATDPRYRLIVAKFVERLGARLDEMDAALERADFEAMAQLAHWLKGSAGTVGFDAFTAPAEELEHVARAGDLKGTSAAAAQINALARRLDGVQRGSAETTLPPREPGEGTVPSELLGEQTQPGSVSTPAPSRATGGGSLDPRMQRIRDKFVERLRERLPEFGQAWRNGDVEELAQLAHWVKGSAGTVGIHELTEPAARLESLARSRDEAQLPQALGEFREAADPIVGALRKAV